MQGAGAVELVPWPHANQAHEWAQSIQADFDLPLKVVWTRLTDYARIQPTTEVYPPACLLYSLHASISTALLHCLLCMCSDNQRHEQYRGSICLGLSSALEQGYYRCGCAGCGNICMALVCFALPLQRAVIPLHSC